VIEVKKIGYFFRDFNKNGGVPKDVEGLANSIAPNGVEVVVYSVGKGKRELCNEAGVTVQNYKKSLPGYIKLFIDITKNKDNIDVIHAFVLFIPVNFLVFLAAKIASIPFIMTPNCVLHKEVMNGKLFFSNKNVAWLGDQGGWFEAFLGNRFTTIVKLKSKLLKKYFLMFFGKKMMQSAEGIHFASKFEKKHAEEYVGVLDVPSLISSWPSKVWIKDKNIGQHSGSYYADEFDSLNMINIVFWSRIDFHFKGIDIMVESIRRASEKTDLSVVIYLIGPDYQGGVQKVSEYINKYDLEKHIKIVDFESVYPSVEPLVDADANIVLSKCDGVLRTVRESMHFGLPQIISEGTQFGDVVEKYNAGFVVSTEDQTDAVNSLSQFFVDVSLDSNILSKMKKNAINAAESLKDPVISKVYLNYYSNIVNRLN